MPSFDDLLGRSMVGTATRIAKLPLIPLATGRAFCSPKPLPQTAEDLGGEIDPDTVLRNPIWRFCWDPTAPATFTKVTCNSRGMGMDYGMPMMVYDRIEFRKLRVQSASGTIDLYLDPAHMMGAWWTHRGEIEAVSTGLWQLEAKLDSSIIVAFGYVLDGNKAVPLSLDDAKAMGDTLIPAAELGPRALDFIAGQTSKAWVCVGPVRYIVLVELALHKERNDFVPGGFVGFARIHPHLMLWSNDDSVQVEASIVLQRPAKGMAHSDAMGTIYKPLLVSDTNEIHDPTSLLGLPLPTTDRLYDYYCTDPVPRLAKRKRGETDHPQQQPNEFTLADARFRRGRVLPDQIKRNSPLVLSDPDIAKEPFQGQYDNVHIAPRMKLIMYMPPGDEVVYDDLVMLNACVHDCTHMHVRWGTPLTFKPVRGWKHEQPYAEAGRPGVPENQTVFASLPNEHTMVYRAIAQKVDAGKLTIFCHHGIGYAIDEWPTAEARAANASMRGALEALANEFEEPQWNGTPNDVWALFYMRVRYTGKARYAEPRSTFDLDTCTR